MDALALSEIAVMCGGSTPSLRPGVEVTRISKDTRTLEPGDLYLAIKGDRFDGNQYIGEAASKGAAAAIADDPSAAVPPGFPVIQVRDSVQALGSLAAAWRAQLPLKVVCVSGSNGKTSTKDFTAAVLSSRFRTIKTRGNFNNQIGLPLSILEATRSDAAAVWEAGMNHVGEIAPLAALAAPIVGIITNIGVAHIEHLGSRDAIAVEKGMLFEALPAGGTAILPAGCDFSGTLAARTRARVILTGGPDSAIRAEDIRISAEGTAFVLVADGESLPVSLRVPGSHMVSNALLAVAAGLALGLSPSECAAGLCEARITGGRLARREVRGVVLLDDTYNANPDSVVAALGVLAQLPCPGRRIAVLGAMGELGAHAAEGYRKVGLAAASSAGVLLAVGAATAPMASAARGAGLPEVIEVETPEEAAGFLREFAREGDLVLVKGSRSTKMEGVIQNF